MSQHNNVSINEDNDLLKGDIINQGEPSFKHSLAAGLPNIIHLPLHFGFDSTSDSTLTTNSQANLSSPVVSTEFPTTSSLSLPQQGPSSSNLPSESSSSLSEMIVDEQPNDISRNTRYRVDFHATRSALGQKGASEGDYNFHDESPFEAARRAQRTAEVIEDRPKDNPYIPGKTRFPSIKPGELVPAHLIWTISAPPTFSPPLEAPSFPPDVVLHNPIRPAHFPSSVYDSHAQPQGFRGPSLPQPPYLPPHLTQSTPSPPPLNPPVNSLDSRPPLRPGPQSQPQPSRTASPAHSSRSAPIPSQSQPPPPFLRSNTDNFRPTASYRPDEGHRAGSLPPLSIPQGPPLPQPRTAPPTRAPSQRQFERPPLPPSLTPGSTLQPPRISNHQPQNPSPLHSGFLPSSGPVRLPSENFRMAQSDHGHDNTPENRGIRSTPKPVMPQLLAPLANTNEKGLANLKRSVSNNPSKGGFLSKTKSLLRKRNSTSTIKLNVDGSIGFNSLSTLVEEKEKQSHHRLLKKK
ncbi:hypothetical protein Clacol_006240 [Clathrus columnatus]|uniref:Uncharacterized protein n=1 Tax=Clathrus columnatus TaxID=1419009 RepID=A0AAV5ABI2_9AGAM|nr:hypothetical protein Clacol_006240 [Clathrus columnatus]